MELCAERGLCLGNTYFKHSSLHKYTKVTRGQERVEVKCMIDLVLVKRDMLRYVQDVRTMRGMGQGLSDHHMVLCKVRLVGPSIKRREVVDGAMSIKSEKLRKDQYRDMLDLLRGKE